MNCEWCGGLFLRDGEDLVCVGGHRVYQHAAPAVIRERGSVRVEPDDVENQPMRPRCTGRLRSPGANGQCSRPAMDGEDLCMVHLRIQRHGGYGERPSPRPTPEPKKATQDDKQCLGRQGRGQCKQAAEPGRDYCPHHNGKATHAPLRIPDPRLKIGEDESVTDDPDDQAWIDRPKAEPPAVARKAESILDTTSEVSAADRSKLIHLLDQEIASVDLRLNALLLHKRALISTRDGLVHGVGL